MEPISGAIKACLTFVRLVQGRVGLCGSTCVIFTSRPFVWTAIADLRDEFRLHGQLIPVFYMCILREEFDRLR